MNFTKSFLRWILEGKQKQGPPKTIWSQPVKVKMKYMGMTWSDLEKIVKDRAQWKRLVLAICASRCSMVQVSTHDKWLLIVNFSGTSSNTKSFFHPTLDQYRCSHHIELWMWINTRTNNIIFQWLTSHQQQQNQCKRRSLPKSKQYARSTQNWKRLLQNPPMQSYLLIRVINL